MTEERKKYTTQLAAGQGLIEETKLLLSIYEPGQSGGELLDRVLRSGQFPTMSARRLRNIVTEAFAPRYIRTGAAAHLKQLQESANSAVLNQLFLYYTAQANPIFMDFVREVFWPRYEGGQASLSTADATVFVEQAARDGKTEKPWSEGTIIRNSQYLMGCCSDFGLLSSRRAAERSLNFIRVEAGTSLYFAYKFHFSGKAENAIISDPAWQLFGLAPGDVRDELKNLMKNGWLIVQSAGEVTRISWKFKSIEEVIDVIAQS